MRATSCTVATSQRFAKPEALPPTSHLPSGLNVSAWGFPLRWRASPALSKDLPSTFQRTTVFSELPVAIHFPSLLKAMETISPTCFSSATGCRVARSQILVRLCKPAAASPPNGLNVRECTGSVLLNSNGCSSPDVTSQNELRPFSPAMATYLLSLSKATALTPPPCGSGNCFSP